MRTHRREPLLITQHFGYISRVIERFPQQRNRSAQRRADGPSADVPDDAVFDESFVAAAVVREPSAEDRALRRRTLPDQRTGEEPLLLPRWSVRPSHHLSAVRPLPAVVAVVCLLAVVAVLVVVL